MFYSSSEDYIINKISFDYEGVNREFKKPVSKIEIELSLPEDRCIGSFSYNESFEGLYYSEVLKSISDLLYKSSQSVCTLINDANEKAMNVKISFYDDSGFKDIYVIEREVSYNDLICIAERFYSNYLICKKG